MPVLQLSTALMGRFFYDYFIAGSVAMYFRQQRYPPPRLISYKITGIKVLWGFGVPLSELSILVAHRLNLRHHWDKSNPHR